MATETKPVTLAFDIGGTGLKAAAFDASGTMIGDRVRIVTPYPLPPAHLVDLLADRAGQLPAAARAAAGFPGMVRNGSVLTAPHFVTAEGPGTKIKPKLVEAWSGFDLAGALQERLGIPVRVANDADVQGSAVVQGHGIELVITLGTGFGTALFEDGHLLPHLEIAHHPLHQNLTYDDYVGERARAKLGNRRWNLRVQRAVATLDAMIFFDHAYIGGGNATHLRVDLGPKVTTVDNRAGLAGCLALWEPPAAVR
jgi:polyphosphate glucokinase